MDRIFGSWWPWGRQETRTDFVSSTSIIPSTVESSRISTTTSSALTTRSAATISNAFYTLINATLDVFNGTTIDPFTNNSLLETNDLTEDELLFGMLWTDSTDIGLEFERNSTNITSTSDIKIETPWQVFSMVATSVILGFIILATVIGEFIFYIYYS